MLKLMLQLQLMLILMLKLMLKLMFDGLRYRLDAEADAFDAG